MSTSSNLSQSTYSPSETETPQGSTQNRIQNFDQSSHAEIGHGKEQSLKATQKEMHQKRIQTLRKELDYLKSTEWEFEYDKGEEEENDEDDAIIEANLAQLQLEEDIKNNDLEIECEVPEAIKDKSCFRKTGVISYIDTKNNYVLIDGVHYFDITSCSHQLNLNDKVLYLGCHKQDNQVAIIRILQNEGNFWGDEEAGLEIYFEQTDHTLIGQVAHRDGRVIYMANGDIKFNLDDVDGSFVPIEGDVLEMSCKVLSTEDNGNDEKTTAVTSTEVLEVSGFRPLGLKIVSGTVTEWNGAYGLCDRKIYFDQQCLPSGLEPRVGLKVIMKTIESYQGKYIYRAIQLQVTTESPQIAVLVDNDEESTLQMENDERLEITQNLSFDVKMNQKSQISLKVTNKSDQLHVINKWIILSKKRDSQINITPFLHQSFKLYPGQSYTFTITCQPKFLGKAKEHLLIMFRGFKVKRVININVVNEQLTINNNCADFPKKSKHEQYSRMNEIRRSENDVVHGRKISRTPNFVAVRLGQFFVPDIMWDLVLGDREQLIHTVDHRKIFAKLEDKYPCLSQDLTIYNYSEKWHRLVYLEEIQESINMRAYDMPKVFLIKYQEYLSLEVNGLSERRPSLVVGDKANVKDIWDKNALKYEGIIHELKGNCILMKFSQAFHETYTGGDLSVEFHFNRTTYRRLHHAINLAISNLGPEILFPSRLKTRPTQVPPENLKSLEWFNENLNSCQRAAVSNILLGECRPKPYCIYGPPGTGKTVTVVETILQILKNIPFSRILVATPSNSAANLITQRLIDYKEKNPHSLVRIISYNYLKSDNIPPNIKSYSVTVDIAREGTSMPKQAVQDSVQLSCQSSYIGRHRVTIGTCHALGALLYMGFPKGHFTHVIVDEAGQATEPEIMIPLTLTDKDNGQIILAGDPMQLGPIVGSPFAQDFGMDESYLSRLLETCPYQKDFTAFQSGFNEKLVTKLNDNYRSLKEVLTLPSQMFYDGSLVERLDRNQPWIDRLINVTSEIFETGDSKAGGIYVYGIRGCNTRAEDSPSWYNPQEATMVALTTSKIYKRNVSADEIGIITPYIAQIKYLRSLFEGMGLSQPKIGTVEEFQGQEKPLIIMSTVRSSETFVHEDMKHTLGFVKNPKRLNVAITRAQVTVILFCDPHLLCTDPLWSRVVNQAVKDDKYMGCDLPKISN